MIKTKTWMVQHINAFPESNPIKKPKIVSEEPEKTMPKILPISEVQQASKNILPENKKQITFNEDNSVQSALYYNSMSFYFSAEDSIKQRMLCYLPLEVISITACINYHLAFQNFCEYILNKFNIQYEPKTDIKTLFYQLPEKIQKNLYEKVQFEPSIFTEIPTFEKLRDYTDDPHLAFNHVQFFMVMVRKLRTMALNIHQNTFYTDN